MNFATNDKKLPLALRLDKVLVFFLIFDGFPLHQLCVVFP